MSPSSVTVDSGEFAGQRIPADKSNFSQTCNLLSQYLRENCTFGDLSLGMSTGMTESFRRPAKPQSEAMTMNLFPVSEVLAKSQAESGAQMTIFYGGQVIVFNDFPADKAKEIMVLASKGNYQVNSVQKQSVVVDQPINISTPSSPNVCVAQRPPQPIVTDLPIARKASLTRFLEKRKDRITARAPYNSSAAAGKPAEAKSWLGLAAPSTVKFENKV